MVRVVTSTDIGYMQFIAISALSIIRRFHYKQRVIFHIGATRSTKAVSITCNERLALSTGTDMTMGAHRNTYTKEEDRERERER